MIAAREVLYRIKMDIKDLEESLDRGEKGLKKTEEKVRATEASLNKMARATGIASAAMVGLASLTIKSAMDFNKSFSNVEALIPGQTKRINELKKEIQALSPQVRKTTGDLAEGLYQVISAFGDSADAAKQLGVAAKLATAGNATTLESINLLSAVTKGYGNTSLEAQAKVSDLATLTVRLGQTTMPELASSIQRVTASSNALGVSQEELFAVFSASTGVIGGAAEVSTGLNQVQSELMKGTTELSGAFEKLGVSTGAELIKKFGGLGGALLALKQSAGGTDEGLIKLFGSVEAGKVALHLTGAGAGKFSKDLKEMEVATGETDKAFKAATTGINAFGDIMNRLQLSAVGLSQKIGEELIESISGLFGPLESAIEWMNKLDDETIKNITTVGKFIGVAAGATAAVIALRKAFMALSLVVMKNPIGLVLGGLAAVGVAVAEAAGAFKDSSQAAEEAADKHKELGEETNSLAEDQASLSKALVQATLVIDEQAQALKKLDSAYKARLELARKLGQETAEIEREHLEKRLGLLTEFYLKEYEVSKNSDKALSKKITGYKNLGHQIKQTLKEIQGSKAESKIEIPKDIESAVKDIEALGKSVEALGKSKGAKDFSINLTTALSKVRSLATAATGELAGLATGIVGLMAENKARSFADKLIEIEQEKNARLLELDYELADLRKAHQEEQAAWQEQFREEEYQKKLAYYEKGITDLENALTSETNIEAYRKTEKKLEEERIKKEELQAQKRKEAEDKERKKKHDAEEKARLNYRQKVDYEFQRQKIETENQSGQAAAEAAQIKAVIDKANSVFALSMKIAEYTALAAGAYATPLTFFQGVAFTAAAGIAGAQIGVVAATPGPPPFRALPMPPEPRPLAQGGIFQPKTAGHLVQPLRVAEAGVPELWLPITQENLDKLLKSVSSTSSSSVTSSFVYQPNFVVNLTGGSDKEEFMSFIKNEASRELLEIVETAKARFQV